MEITISVEDEKLLRQVEELAKKLELRISRKEPIEDRKNQAAIEALEKLKDLNTFKVIEDPVERQRQVRRDRNIGRNE